MTATLLLDLVGRVQAIVHGATTTVAVADQDVGLVAAWCEHTGNELVEAGDGTAVIRRGRLAVTVPDVPADRVPGTRLWLYTNFDCNLACDYCCVRSSPTTPRRALGLDRIRRLAVEAADADVSELLLTGGEPFLLPDLGEIVAACTAALPTTLLTNGMLFHGRRLDRLRAMDRDRLTLHISLDAADPDQHDRHRGAGSWARAVEGIRTARAEGFRVRVTATVPPDVGAGDDAGARQNGGGGRGGGDGGSGARQDGGGGPGGGAGGAGVGGDDAVGRLAAFLDTLGVARRDQLLRPLAHRGVAEAGLELTVETLVPEITVTADGVYWHPVAADHADQFVTAEIFPLAAVIAEVRRRFAEHRTRAAAAAQWFPCA